MATQIRRVAFIFTCCFLTACVSKPKRSPERIMSSIPRTHMSSIPSNESELLTKLMWPVSKRKISQEFRADNYGEPHDGVDIPAPTGTRIYSPASGRVVYAGRKFKGYGKMIIVEHNGELATIFGHCQKILVKSGDKVKKGSLIGLVGKTGRATAPHLHFEVRLHQKPVDPREYLP